MTSNRVFLFDYSFEKHISFPLMVIFRYSWTSSEVEEAQEASLLVAADVIYSDDLTEALFCILEKLMSLGPKKVCINKVERSTVKTSRCEIRIELLDSSVIRLKHTRYGCLEEIFI